MKHLFLTGDSQSGKTTLLLACIRPYLESTGGFMSQRLVDESGDTWGFCLKPVEKTLRPVRVRENHEENLFIERTESGWVKHPEVFAEAGRHLLWRQPGQRLFYLDEIGGMELKVPAFRQQLYEVLGGDIPCLGVIKSQKNFASMGTRIAVEPGNQWERDALEQVVSERYGAHVLEFARGRERETTEAITAFLNSIFQ